MGTPPIQALRVTRVRSYFGGASALQELLGKNKRQGGLLESPPLKVRCSTSTPASDRHTSQTLESVSGAPPASPGLPQIRGADQKWTRSAPAKLGRWVPPRPPPRPPPAESPPAAAPRQGPHRSPGVRRGVRVAAPAAAAAACRSALASNSLHGYSLYGGGGGGAGRSSSGSRRPPART